MQREVGEFVSRAVNRRIAFGVHRGPKDAPVKLVRQVETDADALATKEQIDGLLMEEAA